MQNLSVKDISILLESSFVGNDFLIDGACSSSAPTSNKVTFVNNLVDLDLSTHDSVRTLFLVKELPLDTKNCAFIVTANPRLAFAKVSALLKSANHSTGLHQHSIIEPNVNIGLNVSIGPFSVIHENAFIGDNVIIENGVTIGSSVHLEKNVRVKSNSVLGTDGFGFEYSPERIPIRIHHLGGLRIGENVEIGCNTVICRGTIEDTVIASDVKIDDHVFIAHNVKIGRRSMIIAGTEISGSVTIGDDCWISPQVTILNKVSIGAGATIGIGSVVIRDVEAGSVVAGNPARPLRRNSE